MTGSPEPSSLATVVRSLLPPFLWVRDVERGGALTALVDSLAEDFGRLRSGVEERYDDLFLATCDPHYLPLLASGIGLVGLASEPSDRAYIGRTLELRRRRGTAGGLAEVVGAATGWAAVAYDDARQVGRTYSFEGWDVLSARLADLSDLAAMSDLDRVESTVARRPAISGRPAPAAGGDAVTPAPDSVSLTIGRLRVVPLVGRDPSPARHGRPGAYRCDPLGHDVALYDPAAPLPQPLDHSRLATALERLDPPVAVWQDAGGRRRRLRLAAADLSSWQPSLDHRRRSDHEVLLDPTNGRFLILDEDVVPDSVDYAAATVGTVGGWPHAAPVDLLRPPPHTHVWVVGAPAPGQAVQGGSTLAAALDAWAQEQPSRGLIVLNTGATSHDLADRSELRVGKGQHLGVVAADGLAPVLPGDLAVILGENAGFELRGITLGGRLELAGPGAVALSHVTVAPRRDRRRVHLSGGVVLTADHCVLGSVRGRADGPAAMGLTASVVDGSITGLGERSVLHLEQVTVLGPVTAGTLLALDCIVMGRVDASDDRIGSVSTSYVAAGSRTPVRLGCVDAALLPRFTSTRWTDAAFGQLALDGPAELLVGGSDGGEIGAFHELNQAARLRRLSVVVPPSLPAGVNASIRFEN